MRLAVLIVVLASRTTAQVDTNCAVVKQATQIARPKSMSAVTNEAEKGVYIVQIVTAFRAWQLRHDGVGARRLLRSLPKNEQELQRCSTLEIYVMQSQSTR
jgi:hypothetical protein